MAIEASLRPGERGLALLIVLWMLALLSFTAVSLTLLSRSDVEIARNAAAAAEARALAEAGVARAAVGLAEADPQFRWRADGSVYRVRIGTGEVAVSLRDERGRIDLNLTPREVLESLFRWAGASGDAAALAAAISERRERQSSTPPFAAIEELQTFPGMTPALYSRVAPLVTVHGAPAVDPAVASREVLMALPNADPATVDRLLAARAAPAASQGFEVFRRPISVLAEGITASGGRAAIAATLVIDNPRALPRIVVWRTGHILFGNM